MQAYHQYTNDHLFFDLSITYQNKKKLTSKCLTELNKRRNF
jgi:hypothetical protein